MFQQSPKLNCVVRKNTQNACQTRQDILLFSPNTHLVLIFFRNVSVLVERKETIANQMIF